jgi:hypothetical protein
MAVHTGNQSGPPPHAGSGALVRIAAALLHTVPFGLCAGPLVASFNGRAISFNVAVGGLIGLVAGLVIGTADWLGLQELLRRRGQAPGAEPVATPEPGAAPDRRPAGDLWLVMIGPPVFAALILCLPLMGTAGKGGPWGDVVVLLIVAAVLVIWAAKVSPPCLRELVRRGEWVPPGTAEHPYRVALVLTALLMATVVAVMFAGVWVLQLCGI